MTDYFEASLSLHRKTHGKWAVQSRVPLQTREDLSLAYTPGVARVSEVIAQDPQQAYPLTMKGNSVAIVSDGSSVLGLGNIGPEGALPVMEGKAILFKAFADIDAVPLVVDAKSPQELIAVVRGVAPTFGGINLEDIGAPACFEVEASLQDVGIPVFHDDQHGTAIVLRAALENACIVTGKKLEDLVITINGAGAAGTAIAKLLLCVGHDPGACVPVRDVIVCDSRGIVSESRDDLNEVKRGLLPFTNRSNKSGKLHDALAGADVFIGVSKANLLNEADVKSMAKDPIIFAMANPIPEIMPDVAHKAGAAVVGTGRSDFPNQVNNVLAFPGIFRGALDAHATRITETMKIAAARALAACVENPTPDRILPEPLDKSVVPAVAGAVRETAEKEGVAAAS